MEIDYLVLIHLGNRQMVDFRLKRMEPGCLVLIHLGIRQMVDFHLHRKVLVTLIVEQK